MSDIKTIQRKIAELEVELAAAKGIAADEAKARREATPIIWRFTISPTTSGYHECFDETCALYTIHGEVVNLAEAREAGYGDHALRGGSMVYAFNTRTNRIICSISGGTTWLGSSNYSTVEGSEDSHLLAIAEIGDFLFRHPDGGVITEIIQAHQRRCGHIK